MNYKKTRHPLFRGFRTLSRLSRRLAGSRGRCLLRGGYWLRGHSDSSGGLKLWWATSVDKEQVTEPRSL
jgi:hypothetical protein